MKHLILLISISIVFLSCDTNSQFIITTESDNTEIDSVYITETITKRIIARIALKGNPLEINNEVDSISVGQIQTKDGKKNT